jgi:hypothetical protein
LRQRWTMSTTVEYEKDIRWAAHDNITKYSLEKTIKRYILIQ